VDCPPVPIVASLPIAVRGRTDDDPAIPSHVSEMILRAFHILRC
jgi:hypothetical protein